MFSKKITDEKKKKNQREWRVFYSIIAVKLTLCCFVVYSTRRFVLCLNLCHFVLVFFSPFSIAIISLGEERANLSGGFFLCVFFFFYCTFVRFVLV